MRAIILAAGSGSRLGQHTLDIPKALVDINGKSILERQISLLRKHGVNEISIVIFKRHSYNNRALKSTASKTFLHSQIKFHHLNQALFNNLPSWAWINNREIKISSTEIILTLNFSVL